MYADGDYFDTRLLADVLCNRSSIMVIHFCPRTELTHLTPVLHYKVL